MSSPTSTRRLVALYGLAVALVAVAAILSQLAHPIAPNAFTYFFLAAVLASAWFGGKGPGLLSVLAAALTLDLFFLSPPYTLGIDPESRSYVIPFLSAALVATWIGARLKRAADESSRLTCAIERAADGIMITDTGGRIQYVNPAFTRLTGYSADEVIGKKPSILKSGEQDPSYYEDLWKTIRAGQVWCGQLINRRKDGTLYAEEMTVTPVQNSSGELANFIAIKRDVTERNATEELRAYLASLVDCSADAIIGCTPEGKVLAWNRAAETLYGERAETAIGAPLAVFVRDDLADELRLSLEKRVQQGETVTGLDSTLVRRDGVPVCVSITISPVRNRAGEVAGAVVITHDITAKKRAEEALRASQEVLRAVLNAIPVRVFWKDRNLMYLGCNEPFARDAGLENPEDVIGLDDYAMNWGGLAEGYRADDRAVIESGVAKLLIEETLTTPSGEPIALLTSKVPLRDAKGAIIGVLGTYYDVTERKRAELQILAAKEAAEASSKAKSDFLANMSHEIRTPLNAITGMTDLVLDTALSEQQRHDLNLVKASTDALLNLVNDILDFSKIEARKLSFELIEFSLRGSVDAVMKSLSVQAAVKNLELICRYEPDVPAVVRGDPGRLRQILVNLVGNAIKFTDSGEVVVQVEKLSETANDVQLHFSVRDTGIGIPLEKQQSIFDAFTQADTSSTRRFGGTGLGLTISSRLVEMMGGRIWLESQPGKGSTFHFEVRLANVDNPMARSAPLDTAGLQDLPVLAVDDNPINRYILSEILGRWGMRPTVAAGAVEAFTSMREAHAAGRPFPLVIVDAQMPDTDGFALLERIKLDPLLSGTAVIMLTSSGQPGEAARSLELGASAYLTKPIAEADLRRGTLLVLRKDKPAEQRPRLITRESLWEGQKRLRVLVAEDNTVNQLLAKRLVENQGHSVVLVANGREALEVLEAEAFDLVLMDLRMPEMDGLAATAAIRERERQTGTHLPIIAMTANAMTGDMELCLEAGMDAYVSKPVNVSELHRAIEQAMLPRTP